MKIFLRGATVVALLFVACQILAVHGSAAPPQPYSLPPELARKIEPALLKQLAQQKDELIPFIAHLQTRADLPAAPQRNAPERRRALVSTLQATANRTQVATRAFLALRQQEGKADQIRPFWIVNAIAARASAQTIFELAARPEIEIVKADHTHQLIDGATPKSAPPTPQSGARKARVGGIIPNPNLQFPTSNFQFPTSNHPTTQPPNQPSNQQTIEWNLGKIRADQVWNSFNIDGKGVVVATLDTGVDWQHPALQSKYRGYRGIGPAVHFGNWYDATPAGYLYPGDGNGHGTHTMGLLVGSTPERAIGVAPGAQWISAKIFTNGGLAQDSWIHTGFQWVIAPEGDPSLAPDIVSNSWGDDNGTQTTFLEDVQALRAAGILAVFANGNNGRYGNGTVASPASFDEALGAGATDDSDTIAPFSARGPSPLTDHIKPDVTAPGVAIRSSSPGGGYATLTGTSMAAPHVAGLAALLKQAQPSITITDTIYLITSTAVHLGTPIPNNDYGWGRIDAYAAVLLVTNAGTLGGVVTSGGVPIAGAAIQATDRISRSVQTSTDGDGNYRLPLSPGAYSVSVYAFGFTPVLNNSISISAGLTTTFNVDLAALPTGIVYGNVSEMGSGTALNATISVLATPASIQTSSAGTYLLTLPIGTYTLRAASWQHRVVTATITVRTGDRIAKDFSLATAPSILLVDSGAWYGDSQVRYYQNALDSLGYLYHARSITYTLASVPNITQMLPYSITIWSAPQDSPDYVGAGPTLVKYLDGGGRLFLSGQDIAFWDAGGTLLFPPDYFLYRLYGYFVSDNVQSPIALGVSGEALAGVTFTLNYTDSARNQFTPDQVAPSNDNAHALAVYKKGETAGLAVSTCLPYRAAYLGFGFEGVGPATVRERAMQNIIDWLMASPPMLGYTLSSDPSIAVGTAGQSVTHTLSLRNIGQLSDSYNLMTEGNRWPVSFWNDAFTQSLSLPLTLDSCTALAIGIRTDIPATVGRNVSDSARVTLQSESDSRSTQTRTLVSKTPATVLLVDDDRWYEVESAYQSSLRANNVPFDTFDTQGHGGPPLSRLQMYPLVVWFSGYDWFDPLSEADENNLAAYLNSGGRLFYSAQDYLFVRGSESSFALTYLGVLTYTNDMTVTTVNGVGGNIISDGMGTYSLIYPYRNFSDFLTPTANAEISLIGNHAAGAALNTRGIGGGEQADFKTAFFGFPFEALPANQQPALMRNVVGWLSPLGDSMLVAPPSAPPNSPLVYRLQLSSSNLSFAPSARVTITLPANTTLLSLDDPTLTYNKQSRTIYWSGSLASPVSPQWTMRISEGVAPGSMLIAEALIDDGEGIIFSRRAKTLVGRTILFFPQFYR